MNAKQAGKAAAIAVGLTMAAGAEEPRWYTAAQVAQGEGLYAAHCASCHGAAAEGAKGWKQAAGEDIDAPPLNGSGHASHHSLAQLRQVIARGTEAMGGTMPAFDGDTTAAQRDAMIAYFQSLWSDKTYRKWEKMGQH